MFNPLSIFFKSINTWDGDLAIHKSLLENGSARRVRVPRDLWGRFIAGMKRKFSDEIQEQNREGLRLYCTHLKTLNVKMGEKVEELLAHRLTAGQAVSLRKIREITLQEFCNEDFINNHIMVPNSFFDCGVSNNEDKAELFCKTEEALVLLQRQIDDSLSINLQGPSWKRASSLESQKALLLIKGKIDENFRRLQHWEKTGILLPKERRKASHVLDAFMLSCRVGSLAVNHPLDNLELSDEFKTEIKNLDNLIALLKSEAEEYQVMKLRAKNYRDQLDNLLGKNPIDRAEVQNIKDNFRLLVSSDVPLLERQMEDEMACLNQNAFCLMDMLIHKYRPDKKVKGDDLFICYYIQAIFLLSSYLKENDLIKATDFRISMENMQKDLSRITLPGALRRQISEICLIAKHLQFQFPHQTITIESLKSEFETCLEMLEANIIKDHHPDQSSLHKSKVSIPSFLKKPGEKEGDTTVPLSLANALENLRSQMLRAVNVEQNCKIEWVSPESITMDAWKDKDPKVIVACKKAHRAREEYEGNFGKNYIGALINANKALETEIHHAHALRKISEDDRKRCAMFCAGVRFAAKYPKAHNPSDQTINWDLCSGMLPDEQVIMKDLVNNPDYEPIRQLLQPYWELQKKIQKNQQFIDLAAEQYGIGAEILKPQDSFLNFTSGIWAPSCNRMGIDAQLKSSPTGELILDGASPRDLWGRCIAGMKRICSQEIREGNRAGIALYCKELSRVNSLMGQRAATLLADRYYSGQAVTQRKIYEIESQEFFNQEFIDNHIMVPDRLDPSEIADNDCVSYRFERTQQTLGALTARLNDMIIFKNNTDKYALKEWKMLHFIEQRRYENYNRRTIWEDTGILIPNASLNVPSMNSIHHPLAGLRMSKQMKIQAEDLDHLIAQLQIDAEEFHLIELQIKDLETQIKDLNKDTNPDRLKYLKAKNKCLGSTLESKRQEYIDNLRFAKKHAEDLSNEVSAKYSSVEAIQGDDLCIFYYARAIRAKTMIGETFNSTDELDSLSNRINQMLCNQNRESIAWKLNGQILECASTVASMALATSIKNVDEQITSQPDRRNAIDRLLKTQKNAKGSSPDQGKGVIIFNDDHPLGGIQLPARVEEVADQLISQIGRVTDDKSKLCWQDSTVIGNHTNKTHPDVKKCFQAAHQARLDYQEKHEGALRNAIEEMRYVISEAEANHSLQGDDLTRCKMFCRALELSKFYLEAYNSSDNTTDWDRPKNISDEDREAIKEVERSSKYGKMRDTIVAYWKLELAMQRNKECIRLAAEKFGVGAEVLNQ